MATLAAHCPRLKVVSLPQAAQLTDATLRALAKGCPHLSAVDLVGCLAATDDGLAALGQRLAGWWEASHFI